MKSIRIAALGLALLAGAAGSAGAQAQQQGARGMAGQVERMLTGITLSAEQQAKVDSVQKKYEPQMMEMMQAMRAAREAGTPPAPEMMQKRREMNEKLTAELRAILTPEQATIFDKTREEMMNRMRQGGGGRPPVR
jgi:Spy/CpxP family protein refolding chaperone